MVRLFILILVALVAPASASPEATTSGGSGPDTLAIRSLASPALQSFT